MPRHRLGRAFFVRSDVNRLFTPALQVVNAPVKRLSKVAPTFAATNGRPPNTRLQRPVFGRKHPFMTTRLSILLTAILLAQTAAAQRLTGTITDSGTGEPLTGATVQIEGMDGGAVADADGKYSLHVKVGTYTITYRYVGYCDVVREGVTIDKKGLAMDIAMEVNAELLGDVNITGRANRESEGALLRERQNSSVGIENIGAKEMSAKGLGNVEEGVKKLTGISVADAGQLIVRGLGDRYSTTTLNSLPIASPNPDNKLIPLDIFPTGTVQNVTVSKVYEADAFADYSGAHIDISTKEHATEDFLSVGFSVGGAFNTLGKDFYQMDRDGSLLKTPSMDRTALNMTLTEFDEYVLTKDIFNTTFDVERKSSLPDFDASVGWGHNFRIGRQTLSVLVSATADHGRQITDEASYITLEATGNVQSDFEYKGYTESLNIAALACLQYTLREADRIGYTFFYARNATDTYQLRTGLDAEGHDLVGNNDITHIYSLFTHQLHGKHLLAPKWELTWGASRSDTGSDEPDRRQVMFVKDEAGALTLFKLNRQETMRYYGELDEGEWNADIALKWKWREGDHVKVGFDLKDKDRKYMGTRFYYNVNAIYDEVTDIYNVSSLINQSAVEEGTVVIERKMQPKDSYKAGNTIYAAYALTDWHPTRQLLLNVGLRYEYSKQWVNYATDGGQKYAERRDLNHGDLFPALNAKYNLTDGDILRFSVSRTVTRPSFIEMAPFLYQESYGAAQVRGNAELQNGYNYNVDLRYERFNDRGDMISVTGYFKYLDAPIERVQSVNGGATLHTFQNASSGLAAGAEIELRKTIINGLRLAANVSYMYTDVKLPESGAYTNKERSLQGASPVLANADLTYTLPIGSEGQLSAAVLYNLQGRRIHAVGVSGLGDVKQQTVHTLNVNLGYALNQHLSFKFAVKDLLSQPVVFKQDVPTTGEQVEVERYKKGASFSVGLAYSF